MTNYLKGYLMIFASAIGFGSYGIWSKLIGSQFEVFYQGSIRSALVLAILIPILIYKKDHKKITKQDLKWFSIPVIFGIFTQGPIYYAYNHMDIGTATLIFYAMFLIASYLVGTILIKEKLSTVKLVSLLFAILGLFLVFGVSLTKFTLLASVLAAVNGLASGGEVASTKKVSDKFSTLQLSVYLWGAIVITNLPIAFILGETPPPLVFNLQWFYMLVFAVIGLVSFWLIVEGFKYVDASIGGLIGLTEIIFSVIFGVILFKETLTTPIIIGGTLILLAGMLPDLVTLLKPKVLQKV